MDFEDADTGDELTLQPGRCYQVVETFVMLDENVPHFTYRVKMTRYQFNVKEGYEGSKDLDNGIEVIDLEDTPDNLEGL